MRTRSNARAAPATPPLARAVGLPSVPPEGTRHRSSVCDVAAGSHSGERGPRARRAGESQGLGAASPLKGAAARPAHGSPGEGSGPRADFSSAGGETPGRRGGRLCRCRRFLPTHHRERAGRQLSWLSERSTPGLRFSVSCDDDGAATGSSWLFHVLGVPVEVSRVVVQVHRCLQSGRRRAAERPSGRSRWRSR